VLVALDARERDRALADLALFLAATGGGAVLLSLGLGILLARSVLGPVHRMTAEAATLTPEDMERRLRPDTVVKELHRLAETLNSALDRLGEAMARQRRFASDASHELRTPVSVLMANAELLLRRPRSEEEYRMGLRRQLKTAGQMRDVAENLLALARADASADGFARDPLLLDEVAAAAAADFAPLAEEGGVRLEVANGRPVPVTGDPVHLHRLVSNLVSNAVKFTPAGGVVSVRASAEDGEATLTVEDTGPGIAKEHLGRIFDRFYRICDARHQAEGAGLGLAIVDGIVRAHGGRIEVESRPGEGSRFRVRMALRGHGDGGEES
ncbi:MAG: HAMP domain-containing protein, partial [Planctomycetaceae bacterium]|nr:HAMP domain-containing protein [Planctomycetaceae bacterium]